MWNEDFSMIEQMEVKQSIEELKKARDVKIEIELSAWETYCFIVAVQMFKVTHSKLGNVTIVGEIAARELSEKLANSCPATYRLLNNGWNLKSEPGENSDKTNDTNT